VRKIACLAVLAILFLTLLLSNDLLAFKAPDDSRFSVKSIGISAEQMELQDILVDDLNRVISGDVVQAAKDIIDGIMKARFAQTPSRQKDGGDPGRISPPFTAQVKKVQTDSLGFTHVRIAQLYHGLPVVGGEVVVHINNHNIVYYISGRYLPPLAISIEPSISAEAVLQAALKEFAGTPDVTVSKQPSLVVFGSHLAYYFVIEQGSNPVGQWWHYVDAHTGELLQRYNNIKFLKAPPTPGNGSHKKVSGNRLAGEDGSVVKMTGWKEKKANFYLYSFNSMWGVYDEVQGDWEQQASNNWGTVDRAAVSAGYNFALTQAWVKNVLKRNSFDDAGGFAKANVHMSGGDCPNAWWDGTDFHFCDGDYIVADDLDVLDIVAHEYGHAVTEHTSNLIYGGEAGALNESYSDVMAAAVEFAKQTDGTSSYPNHTPGRSDWLIGEDAWRADEALRDMRNPKRFEQPSYYRGQYWYFGNDDNGGVHTNSGVQNFAFYLLAQGGSGTNEGHRYRVEGIGIKRAAAVAMRANVVYLTPSSTHLNARNAWIKAGTDLDLNASSVEAAWAAVGVGRYRDNGDDTVTDLGTGLVWQKSDDGNQRTWEEANAYCAASGWRVPRVDELHTIVDYSRYQPAIDPVFECPSTFSWSGNTSVHYPDQAWAVDFFSFGYVGVAPKDCSIGSVRCVRGGPFWPFDPWKYLEATNETVQDSLTHLEWQRNDDGVLRNFDQASSYCSGLVLGEHNDWRLPTIQELATIVKYQTYDPSASSLFGCHSWAYWSQSTHAYHEDSAWGVDFYDGLVDLFYKPHPNYLLYVRCVRSIP
jgi:Zn-dependent metalloprotease